MTTRRRMENRHYDRQTLDGLYLLATADKRGRIIRAACHPNTDGTAYFTAFKNLEIAITWLTIRNARIDDGIDWQPICADTETIIRMARLCKNSMVGDWKVTTFCIIEEMLDASGDCRSVDCPIDDLLAHGLSEGLSMRSENN